MGEEQDQIMSQNGKVIELGAHHAGYRMSSTRVLPALRGLAAKRLKTLLHQLFDNLDDALFDMAERADSNQSQTHFFDGMRELRKKRPHVEAAFNDAHVKLLNDFEAKKLAPSQQELGAVPQAGAAQFSLIEDGELEESLAVTAIIDRADVKFNRPLYALNQRLAYLLDNTVVDNANNPFAPRLLCQAFNEAIQGLEVDIQVKLIVLKLFERHVLANLEDFLDEANQLLVQAGIMPDLRFAVAMPGKNDQQARKSAKPTAAEAEAIAETLAEATETLLDRPVQYGPEMVHSDTEIMSLVNELKGLLSVRRKQSLPVPATGSANADHYDGNSISANFPAPSAREIFNALSMMQSELKAQAWQEMQSTVGVDQVKSELLNQVKRLGGKPHVHHLGADEDTIDLVGMLFDYAVQDRQLPAPIQALLSRLQIPYLKVALLDREFVAHKNHPARKLLDELAYASVGWSEESDKDGRLFGEIKKVVSTLIKDFDDDMRIFDKLSAEFADFIDKNRKRAELVEKRTAESVKGREKIESAQRTAAQVLLARIRGKNLPVRVSDLLTRRWSNYLVLTHLRHGEDSSEWRNAVRFIDDFAWSVEPMSSDSDRVRLRELSPEIERMLRQGLTSIGFHESHLDELWEETKKIYDQQLDGRDGFSAQDLRDDELPAPPNDALTIRFASSKAGEEIVFTQEQADAELRQEEAVASPLDSWLGVAKTLKAGTWFEFVRDDGTRERAKLLWISTIKALYLFVNRNGIKIAEKTALELADELKTQRTVILEQVALVDRALDAILKKLRENDPSAGPAGNAPPVAKTERVDGAQSAAANDAPQANGAVPPSEGKGNRLMPKVKASVGKAKEALMSAKAAAAAVAKRKLGDAPKKPGLGEYIPPPK